MSNELKSNSNVVDYMNAWLKTFHQGYPKFSPYFFAVKKSEGEEYLDKLDPHFSGRDFWLVAFVENLSIFDLELDVLVEGNATPHPLEDVQVGRDGQVTV